MRDFFTKKIISPALGLFIALACIGGTLLATQQAGPKPLSTGEMYQAAVLDAMVAQKDEIRPLVEITPQSDMVTWNQDKTRILLLTWHKYPESYVAGQNTTLKWGEVWTFTDKEILKWYKVNKGKVTDWNLRLEQLLGLPADAGYTHVSALWVDPKDVLRPAYDYDISDGDMETSFPDKADPEFVAWFDANIISSYFEGSYPWTRLGYTYDWGGNGSEYGVSEFIIKKDAKVTTEFTLTTAEFLDRLERS